MDRIELRLKMEAETKKASDNENGNRTDVSEEYVEWLEQQVKNCSIPAVVGQSEQFSLSDIYKIAQNYTEEQFIEMVKHVQG